MSGLELCACCGLGIRGLDVPAVAADGSRLCLECYLAGCGFMGQGRQCDREGRHCANGCAELVVTPLDRPPLCQRCLDDVLESGAFL